MLSWLRQLGITSHATSVDVAHRSPRLPPDERVYAIGDIHGRLDLVRELEKRIAGDIDARPIEGRVTVVYLGDYVDRGPDSKRVLDFLVGLPPAPLRRQFVIGNHDWWLREFVRGGRLARAWLQSGGDATLRSYGVNELPLLAEPERVAAVRRQLLRRMPPAHTRFLVELVTMHRQGAYLFVHAGVRPGTPIAEQEFHDLVSIREPFLSSTEDLGAIVVHGHTVVEQPVVRPNRIGIDTGAHWTNCLTAAVLEGDDVRFLQTGGAH